MSSLKKSVSFYTLGCRLNIAETGRLTTEFEERGYLVVPFGESASISIINTCTVTDGADSSSRNIIRKAHRSSPDGKTIVIGCYAQLDAEPIAVLPGVELVLGNSEKFKIFLYLDKLENDNKIGKNNRSIIYNRRDNIFYNAVTSFSDCHTRAFLKVQDGCNYYCGYCIIPKARGVPRSLRVDDAVVEVRRVTKSANEIVLTGINIGEYGSDYGSSLSKLLEAITTVDSMKRVRISSIEPNTITDDLLEVIKRDGFSKIMNHLHIPLQSGDDKILVSMRRKYRVSQYEGLIFKLKDMFKDISIGTDVIVGLPGESDKSFEATVTLLKRLPIDHFHIFPYSKRRGTLAADMDDQVEFAVKKERAKILRDLGDEKLDSFHRGLVGTRGRVLFERKNRDGFFEGYTTNFAKIYTLIKDEDKSKDLSNQIRDVEIIRFDEDTRKLFVTIA